MATSFLTSSPNAAQDAAIGKRGRERVHAPMPACDAAGPYVHLGTCVQPRRVKESTGEEAAVHVTDSPFAVWCLCGVAGVG